MIRFAKLLHFECYRFRYFYLALLLVTAILQSVGLLLFTAEYMQRANRWMTAGGLSQTQFLERIGPTSFARFSEGSLWFVAPIALCIVALLLYVFLIW
ncbi:MAG TPA: hypothetical protein VF260_12180, partial [Bacilli bacterium]